VVPVRDLASVPLEGREPVRRFSWHRAARHRSGLEFLVSTGRLHGFESLAEAKLLLMLDFAGGVTDVLSQPLRLRFLTEHGVREHIPDFFAETRGGGMWPRHLSPRGRGRIWPSGRTPRPSVARRGGPRPDRADARLMRDLLLRADLSECWIPPAIVVDCRAILELYRDLREQHEGWIQRIRAVLFHHGCTDLGPAELTTATGRARLEQAAAIHLTGTARYQVTVALHMIDHLEAELEPLYRQIRQIARRMRGPRVLREQLYGVGPVTALALTCWLGGSGRGFSSRGAVRFTGLDTTVHSRPTTPSMTTSTPLPPVSRATPSDSDSRDRSMTLPKPAARARSALSGRLVVEIASDAPSSRATCIEPIPTAPPTAGAKTLWPGWKSISSVSVRYAVR
jgi:hypothetical protein